jgi:guanosine-3',5'-bis(diphosphate) 3'-pyrophosphohydrolase
MNNSLDNRAFLEAVSFAARAHHGQLRKDGATPYVSHVFRVCLVVRQVFGFDDPQMLIAALLHDTIEDTTTDRDDITERFGPEIATWVAYLSKDKRLPDEERERQYREGLCAAPWQVQVCKLADVYDNLMDSNNLPREVQARSLRRVEQTMEVLRKFEAPQVQAPIRMVQELLKSKLAAAVKPGKSDGSIDKASCPC